MSVSAPGTIVIFTQMSGFAVLNASTIVASTFESGGVWVVQNLTTVAEDEQAAPVTGVGSALAPAAAEALGASLVAGTEAAGGAEAAVLAAGDGELLELQAARTTTIDAARTAQRDRPRTGLMAPPLSGSPGRYHGPFFGVGLVRSEPARSGPRSLARSVRLVRMARLSGAERRSGALLSILRRRGQSDTGVGPRPPLYSPWHPARQGGKVQRCQSQFGSDIVAYRA